MNSSRGTFLLGSLSTLALAGCGGNVPLSGAAVLGPLGSGPIAPGSIRIIYSRRNAPRSIARFSMAFRAAYPNGSKVYYYGMYVVQDGPDYAAFPQSSAFSRDSNGVHVYNAITKLTRSFSRSATMVLVADAGEVVVGSDAPVEPYLRSQIVAGQAYLVTTIGESTDGCAELPQTASTVRLPSARARGTLDDCSTGSDGSGDIAYSGPNQIMSSHVQCASGGENIGLSYHVPSGYSSNVTVTQCIDNGTTNICFNFTNQVPGSTHNVSVWVNGYGAPGISMGIISGGNVQDGIGWASLSGC